jgi:hypothetical protein
MKRILWVNLIITLSLWSFLMMFLVSSCNQPSSTSIPATSKPDSFILPTPSPINSNSAQYLLLGAGYGYEYGDVILLDTQSPLKPGDIVLFNAAVNKSDFQAFGTKYSLVKIIALPGDSVTFQKGSYTANGYKILLRQDSNIDVVDVAWGSTIIADVSGSTLQIPENEYLGDRWIGMEGGQNKTGESTSMGYNRFTIKKEAISGIVVKKIEHRNIPQIVW